MNEPIPSLAPDEVLRYGRHLVMPEVGAVGQRRLKASSVLVVGAGGLGSPLALYLAAAGVGRLGLVDFDQVDITNLQRQLLYGTRDIGRPKLEAAAERLRDLNPHVAIELHPVRLASDNALDILRRYDVIVDGTDNFATRYLVNDACVLLGKPNVHGSIFRFEGQLSVFDATRGPCYRCLYPDPPPAGTVPSCAEGGVLGVLPGLVGVMQAIETIKLVLGVGETLIGRLLIVDALDLRFRELKLRRDPACPMCGTRTITELQDYEAFCGVTDESAAAVREMSVRELEQRRGRGTGPLVLDVREPAEWEISHIEGSRLIPLGTLEDHLGELSRDQDVVVMCHHGIRSRRGAEILGRAGFSSVWNLAGGIDAWSREIDPAVARY